MLIPQIKRAIIERPFFLSTGNAPRFLRKASLIPVVGLHLWALREGEHMTPEELRALQLHQVKRLITHAFDRIPFWKKRINQSTLENPQNLKQLHHLELISPTTRQELKQYSLTDLIIPSNEATYFERFLYSSTSGSTNVPFRFCLDRLGAEREIAMILRGPEWGGFQLSSDTFIRVFAIDFPLLSPIGKNFPLESLRDVDKVVIELRREEPRKFLLYSHLSTLLTIARRIKELSIAIRPRVVLTASEKMHEEDYTFLKEIFSCSVSDSYGSREIDNVSQTCLENNMHINAEHCYVEIVDESGKTLLPGKQGRITVTSFNNYAMPFIRYQLGDFGSIVLDACPCGRPFPILSFDGRAVEFVHLPNGEIVHTFEMNRAVYGRGRAHWILQYQIIRKGPWEFSLKLVVAKPPAEHELLMIRNDLKSVVGHEADISIELVASLFEPGRKAVSFVSRY